MEQYPLLAMRNISKSFPGVKALDNLNFDLRSGEVHGAGKARLFYVHILIHLAYGCGFWAGIFRHWILGR